MTTTRVELTFPEFAHTARAGLHRQLINLGRPDRLPTKDPYRSHIEGAVSEYAVSLVLNMSWRPVLPRETKPAADVGTCVEVRSRPRMGDALPVRRGDPDDARFVLAWTHELSQRVVHVVGWIPGAEAKRDEWWAPNAPYPAYFVPVGALYRIEGLRSRRALSA